jgi:hypothetical protein
MLLPSASCRVWVFNEVDAVAVGPAGGLEENALFRVFQEFRSAVDK